MIRGGKSRTRKQRGGVAGQDINVKYIEDIDGTPIPYITEEQKAQILADIQQRQAAAVSVAPTPAPLSAPAAEPTTVATDALGQPLQSGGKRRGRKATKKGGDMGAGLLTAGTLLLIQAAAKSLLAKKEAVERRSGRRGRPSRAQRGGQVIESRPAAFDAGSGSGSALVQSTLSGGSMCGVPAPAPQQGGKKKTTQRRKKQTGGDSLNTTGDLTTAFNILGAGQHSVAYDQAATAAVAVPPFQVSGAVSQDGGRRKRTTKKRQSGGGALNIGGELEAAFSQQPVPGAIPLGGAHVAPHTPATLTALHTQTGGRKRSAASKSKSKK